MKILNNKGGFTWYSVEIGVILGRLLNERADWGTGFQFDGAPEQRSAIQRNAYQIHQREFEWFNAYLSQYFGNISYRPDLQSRLMGLHLIRDLPKASRLRHNRSWQTFLESPGQPERRMNHHFQSKSTKKTKLWLFVCSFVCFYLLTHRNES